jgi:hypothetical protein
VPAFLLHHRHDSSECGIAFAAWRGYDSPLRHRHTVGTCALGGHELWWLVDAPTRDGALDQLPPWLAARTRVTRIRDRNDRNDRCDRKRDVSVARP